MIDYFGNNPRDKSLNFAYPFVASACTKAYSEVSKDRAIKDVIQLINDFPEYQELITKKLISDLTRHIKEKKGKLKGADKRNAVIASQLQQLSQAEKILKFLKDGKFKDGVTKRIVIEHSSKENKRRAHYAETHWFKIGVKFANGEMDKLLEKYNYSATQVAEKLGNIDGYRPYISATANHKINKSDKNIYGSINKMDKIHAYCTENNITPKPHFIAALKRLQSK